MSEGYTVVEFLGKDDFSTSVVPILWLDAERKNCMWPKYGKTTSKYIVRKIKPKNDWISYPCTETLKDLNTGNLIYFS